MRHFRGSELLAAKTERGQNGRHAGLLALLLLVEKESIGPRWWAAAPGAGIW